jgi:hypothetical protein
MLEIVFEDDESHQKAIEFGVTINNIVYRGTPWVDEARRKTMKVNLAHIPLKLNKTLGTVLKSAMEPYGEVLQIRKYVNVHDRFYGEASVILDRGEEDTSKYEDLTRFVFLEESNVCVPATFQGAPKVCYHCRSVGHERRDCPELASLQCFKCKGFGHLRRHCKFKRDENLHEEDIRHYEQAQQTHMDEDLFSICTNQEEEGFEDNVEPEEPESLSEDIVSISSHEPPSASPIIPVLAAPIPQSDPTMEIDTSVESSAISIHNHNEDVIIDKGEALAISTASRPTSLKRKHEKSAATAIIAIGRPKTYDTSRISKPYNKPTKSSLNHANTNINNE